MNCGLPGVPKSDPQPVSTNMKRLAVLKIARAITWAVLVVSAASLAPELFAADSPAPAASGRPNIVFIFGDDSGIDAYGCYGSDRFKAMTPNIDSLAASGLRFERCFATPLCGPSRCVINTGRYGFRTGGMSNQSAGNASYRDEPALARVLKQAGYATGMAGKWRQMSDSPGDWGFDEYITDPTAGGWYWETKYEKNGKTVTTPEKIYYPEVTTEFAIDFMTRHRDEPFYFYLSQHLIHGKILPTPDSKSDATASDLYDDNVRYLDKVVGQVVAALDKLGLRERTLIVFSADNGTATVGYTEEHDPRGDVGKIGGRAIYGHKGQLLEGGSRVPLVASWKGTLPAGGITGDLIDFSDFIPTFAELAGATLPAGVTFDGHSFAPQLRGQKGSPREWVFVQLGRGWYVRDDQWKLTREGDLFSMKDAPFAETPVPSDSDDPAAQQARKRLGAVLADLNPSGGKQEPTGQGKGKKARRKMMRQQRRQQQAPETKAG